MEFITIDFETASSDDPCEIGLTFVQNGKIIETKSWLIKPGWEDSDGLPFFDDFNMSIHGITPKDVIDKPTFGELWSEIQPLIENKFLIAHYASFDMRVLRNTLERSHIPFPSLDYACSCIFAKKVWEGLPSYNLETLCKVNNIELEHHRAANDSRATAELCLKAFEIADVTSLDDFSEKLRTIVGKLYPGGYEASRTKRLCASKDISKIVGNPEKHNPDSIFYGKTVVFTGTLSMRRIDAQQKIVDIGGILGKGIAQDTDFLIVGQQDYRVVGDDGMSSKQEKAIKMIEKGTSLEILSEDDFLKNI